MARTAEYLVVDIETIPDTERWQRPADAPQQQTAFPPLWAHRVLTIGYLRLDAAYRPLAAGIVAAGPGAGSADAREAQLLAALGRAVGKATLVTYNGRSFDLPVIALRSLAHAVPMPWYYRETTTRYRYSEHGHLDLCDWLADHGAVRAGSLDALARLVGLPGKVGVDGSQVEGLHAAGRIDEIERYCLADVAQTALLFLRFRLLQGVLRPELYQEVTGALLDALAADGRVGTVLEGTDRAHLIGPPPAPPTPAA